MNERATCSTVRVSLDLVLAALALLVFNAYATDLLRQPLTPLLPCLLTAAELAVVVVRLRPHMLRSIDWGEASGLALTVAGVFLVFSLPSLPSFYPPSSGVDAVHHFLLADFIYQNHALPHDIVALSPYLGEMAVYPFAPALLVALASQVMQLSPLLLLHPFMSLVRALSAGYVFVMAYQLLPQMRGRVLAALAAPLLLFTPATYFVGSLLGEQYYFAQVFAELLVVALGAHLLSGRLDLRWAALLTGALLLTYPAWLPVMLLGCAAIVLLGRGSARTKARDGILLASALVLLLIVYLPGRMQAGVSVLRWEGIAQSPSLGAFGWPLLALAAAGLAVTVRDWKRLWPAILFAGICLVQSAAMFVLSDILHLAARYHLYKSLYLLIYPLVVLAVLAVGAGVRLARARFSSLLAAGLGLALVAVTSWSALAGGQGIRPIHVLRPEQVAAGRWAKENLDVTQVGYRTRYGITSYWLHVAILGNKRESSITDSFVELLPMTEVEWLQGGVWPQYLLASDDSEPPDGNVTVVYRHDGVAVWARQPVTPPRVASAHRRDAEIGGLLHVAGFGTGSAQVSPGQTFDISVYWYVLHWPRRPAPLYMYAHLLDNASQAVGKVDRQPQDARFGSLRWPMGVVNTDTFSIALPANAPPGRYVVQVGMYAGDTLKDLPVALPDKTVIDRFLLGPFKIALPVVLERPAHAVAAVFGERMELLGYDLGKQATQPGTTVALRLYWQASAAMSDDHTTFVHMVNKEGQLVAQCDVQAADGAYPTSIWDVGEIVTTDCVLTLPSSLPAGSYDLRAGVYLWQSLARLPVAGGADMVDLASMSVTLP